LGDARALEHTDRTTRKQGKQDGTDAKQIGPWIGWLEVLIGLLGSHELGGPNDRAGPTGSPFLRYAKIKHLDDAARPKQVLGLEIEMNDPMAMRRHHHIEKLVRDGQDLIFGQLLATATPKGI